MSSIFLYNLLYILHTICQISGSEKEENSAGKLNFNENSEFDG
jgi:hypothetical protein